MTTRSDSSISNRSSTPPSPRTSEDFQDGSSVSSSRTTSSRHDPATKRRGFMRPQGTEFSSSAKSRESVMALGSIAHLQYFFAKTGLLDGKGGGLKKKKDPNLSVDTTAPSLSPYPSPSTPDMMFPDEDEFYMDYLTDMEDYDFDPSVMLPPTTSTYNPQSKMLPPPPEPDVLRGQLRQSLALTKATWENAGVGTTKNLAEGYQELKGTELVDLATSAVRAAKSYYYTTDISLLTTKDDRTLREEFLAILDVLKRMAQRKFEGGVKTEERQAVLEWITGVEAALDEEEKAIADLRSKGREWLEGSWDGREYELNHMFLSYFDTSPDPLPPAEPIDESTILPTPFLKSLQTGLRLITIHNAVVRRSRRPFGQIMKFHTEFSKPYRLAENLRFWKKAAEIRWEVRLKFDVMAVVNNTQGGWRDFDRDLKIWCSKVLEEVRSDWALGEGAAAVGHPSRARALTNASMGRPGRSQTNASMNVEVGD